MQKIIFTDKTEFEIMPGAGLNNITVLLNDFVALGKFTETLRKKGNLDSVQFKQDELITGEYKKLALSSSIYSNVDVNEDGKVLATFGFREKTKLEITVETLQADQLTQDDAIMELASMIGGKE